MSTNPNALLSQTAIEISLEHYCEMTVSGMIAPDDSLAERLRQREPTKLVLSTPDGLQFRAAPLGDITLIKGDKQWRVIPIMQTDGNITRLQIVEAFAETALEPDKFVCVARICQVSSKHNMVTAKIDKHGEQAIRPTFLNPPEAMKTGQLLQIVAQRVGKTLEILKATHLDPKAGEESTITSRPSVAPKTV